MTREELQNNYWNYYCVLEEKVLATNNYVEIHKDNYNSFSYEYALLLQCIGAELDNFFKEYCGFALSDRKKITDYATYILNTWNDIKTQKIQLIGRDIELMPFHDWDETNAASSLSWWKAFDDIKHNRLENKLEAKQENVLNILAALFLLEMKMFEKIANSTNSFDIPDEESRLFKLRDWKFKSISLSKCFATDLVEI